MMWVCCSIIGGYGVNWQIKYIAVFFSPFDAVFTPFTPTAVLKSVMQLSSHISITHCIYPNVHVCFYIYFSTEGIFCLCWCISHLTHQNSLYFCQSVSQIPTCLHNVLYCISDFAMTPNQTTTTVHCPWYSSPSDRTVKMLLVVSLPTLALIIRENHCARLLALQGWLFSLRSHSSRGHRPVFSRCLLASTVAHTWTNNEACA